MNPCRLRGRARSTLSSPAYAFADRFAFAQFSALVRDHGRYLDAECIVTLSTSACTHSVLHLAHVLCVHGERIGSPRHGLLPGTDRGARSSTDAIEWSDGLINAA